MKHLTVLGALLLFAACASEPTLQTGPDAETTFDGLVKIENSAYREAWADPDIDFSRYNKMMPGGAFFEFRAVKKSNSTTAGRSSSKNEFWISDENKEKFKNEVSAVFDEELAKSTRFAVTDTPGEDVLILRGGLHDIVSRVPPQYIGRSDIYISSVGEATLILEAVDSMSGEVIFRAVERRAMQRPGGQGMIANTVTTWAEVRRTARGWATTLREGLDRIPEQ